MKHLLLDPHIIFSVENPKYEAKKQYNHEATLKALASLPGNKPISMKGHYGAPENSIFVSNPSDEQRELIRHITKTGGQESYLSSDGFTHKLVHTNGPQEGSIVMGQGTEFHEQQPEDYYSVFPDGTIFTHNLGNYGEGKTVKTEIYKSDKKEAPQKFYHLTDNPKFTLDPNYAPQDNSISINDRSGRKGIYLAPDIEPWINAHGYLRPYVAEFEVDPSALKEPGVHGRWAGEKFIPNSSYGKLKLNRVIPTDAYAREVYGGHGWIEERAEKEFDTGKPIKGFAGYPFKGYRYDGKDVRDMSPEEIKNLTDHFESIPKNEMKKALSPEELKSQGYKFKILKPTSRREAYAVVAYHKNKKVGHLLYSPALSFAEDKPVEDGFHEVHRALVEPEHRGKGIYQGMLNIAADHVKSIGGKGVMSRGYQRSPDATRAWDKVGSFAVDAKDSSIKPLPYRANYFLQRSESLQKGARGDWKKEGYTLKFHPPKVEMFNGKHDITSHRVTAHDSQGNRVGDYHFSEWPEASEHKGLLHVTFSRTDPDHQRKGLASAAYSMIEQRTGKKVHSSPGNRSADAKKLWSQPNRSFGKSDKIPGGLADKKTNKDFPKFRITQGRKVEMEHTSSPRIAEEIARDHLTEDPKYYDKLKTIEKSSTPSIPKVKLNPEHGKMIADAYHNMKHDPNHPEVKASYNALIEETKKQYQNLLDQGYKFTKISDLSKFPYKSSKEMHRDIQNNKHLYYWATDTSDPLMPKDHPLLAPTDFKSEDGKPMLANCLLRQVHDINGHFHGGKTTFGPVGEHKAYLNHKKMYSEKAQPALATELIMQNSHINFGPHGEHNIKNPYKAIFSPQKTGLVPDWVWKKEWHQ